MQQLHVLLSKPRAWLRSRVSLWLVTALGIFAVVAAVFGGSVKPVHATTVEETEKARRAGYDSKVNKTYNDQFSQASHFLPSLMTTDTGQFIDPKDFPTAQYCGHCHRDTQHQWRESAHSNSNRAPWYLRNVDLLAKQKGVEFTRHCEGCHDPVAMAAGMLTQGSEKRRPFDADGVTCTVCHSIQQGDTRGTGSYVLGVPAVLVDEAGKPIHRQVNDGEILAHLDRHSAAVMRPFYKTAEFCASCHKAALPRQLNDYKWQRAISLHDEWQNSSFAKQSPLPFYVKDSVSTCQTCHMQRETQTMPDPGSKEGKLASHRWLGANTVVPQNYKFEQQGTRVVEFLKSGFLNVDIFALEHKDGKIANQVSAPLGGTRFRLAAGQEVTADVVIQNKGIAHSLVPEQRDFYEAWVDFTVSDKAGKVLFESGSIGPDGTLDPRAHSFTNRLINKDGKLNAEHQVWDNRIVAYNNTIQSGRSQLVRYAFHMPSAAHGEVLLKATVRYRRFNQHFIDFAMDQKPGTHYPETIVDMASTTRMITVGENNPSPAPAGENATWMRWNNYGIALMDAQQYGESRRAFEQVATLRPDYADAYVNQALAEFSWQRFADARAHLDQALKLSPASARAHYYMALVDRNDGNLTAAVAHLQIVAAAFPRSRDAHRELGFSFYQQHRYAEAKDEYLAVQAIDPDDLASHYILAMVYRRLGMKTEAARESAAFADQKDDPAANTFALDYLNGHPEVASESVVWHAHQIDAPNDRIAGPLPTTFTATQN